MHAIKMHSMYSVVHLAFHFMIGDAIYRDVIVIQLLRYNCYLYIVFC